MKKDPVLWVVVDKKTNSVWSSCANLGSRKAATAHAKLMARTLFGYAPFRVVKYVPAPKTKRKRKA